MLVLPEGPETDLTDINSLLLDVSHRQFDYQGAVGGTAVEGIPLCSLSPGGITARCSPPKSGGTRVPIGNRRGGHSARGSLAEEDTEPETAAAPPKAAQVSKF